MKIQLTDALKNVVRRTMRTAPSDVLKSIEVKSTKLVRLSEEKRLAYYWLSQVETADGKIVVDSYGHIISEETLEDAAIYFMRHHRVAGLQHEDFDGIGTVVQSWVTTKQWQQSLGIPPGILPVGWMVCSYVEDDDTWAGVKNDVLPDMSLGGTGMLRDVQVDDSKLTTTA